MSQSPSETPNEQEGTVELTESDRHRLLASERRRLVIDLLKKRTTPVDLQELAAGIAAREQGTTTPAGGHINRVAITLHHSHLPMMADLGVIDYDPASRCIESVRMILREDGFHEPPST